MMEVLLNYVKPELVILAVALYMIGLGLKKTEFIKDKYIPCILLAIGIVFSIALIGLNVNAVIQGILVSGAAVLGNQLIKQYKKENE